MGGTGNWSLCSKGADISEHTDAYNKVSVSSSDTVAPRHCDTGEYNIWEAMFGQTSNNAAKKKLKEEARVAAYKNKDPEVSETGRRVTMTYAIFDSTSVSVNAFLIITADQQVLVDEIRPPTILPSIHRQERVSSSYPYHGMILYVQTSLQTEQMISYIFTHDHSLV